MDGDCLQSVRMDAISFDPAYPVSCADGAATMTFGRGYPAVAIDAR
jgi:hypothetical protein